MGIEIVASGWYSSEMTIKPLHNHFNKNHSPIASQGVRLILKFLIWHTLATATLIEIFLSKSRCLTTLEIDILPWNGRSF